MADVLGSIRDAVKRAASEVSDELKHKGAQGSHELAAAIFNGNAFVMYPKNQAAEQNEQSQEKSQEAPQQEQSHGRGR